MRIEPTFRLNAFHEAMQCLRMVEKLDVRQPEFWSNLLGAIINTNIAAIPDSVAGSLMQEQAEHQRRHDHLREKIKEKLPDGR